MNRFGSLFKPLTWFMALLLAAFVGGCGGGDDSSGPPPKAAPIGLVFGDWAITESVTTADNPVCASSGNNALDNYTITVTQTGNDLTVARGVDPAVAGSISGDQVTWSGNSYDEPGIANGVTTVTGATATVGASCDDISGSFNWTHTNPSLSCSGTTTFTGTGDGSGCGA
ncbi:MAG TPA: hypothetical protein VJT81_12770 [Burkholderiales bacterium]|nr:hypothetical protein [Burkholderiales bacterium]